MYKLSPLKKRKDFLITFFFDYKKPLPLSRHCEERSDEAIAPLHIPFSIKCFGVIASLTAFARNDVVGLQTRNGDGRLFACNGVKKTMLIALQRSCFLLPN